ncbi:porin [Sutterella wadsworthensis]|uniref:porin n=3 Tax=Sutterella wadsworthensis TaxID=40545 RepID=UPI0013F65E6E|nr:porin [Sutterella wadsworthensis]
MATSNTPAYTHITLASALLVLCGVLPQSVSAAQTEVYGKLETSIRYLHVNGSDSGNKLEMLNEGSRWGLKIKEDLSSELSVRGYLESGFNSDDGALSTTNTLFDRRSILALNSKTFGEIGFGRMGSVRSTMSPYSLGLAWMDPFETGYGTDSSISTIFGNDPRSSNMVTWVSPKLSGFRAGLTYSFNTAGQENTSERLNNRLLSGALAYQGDRLFVSVGATQQWTPRSSTTLTNAAKETLTLKGAPEDAQAYTIGASYQATDEWKLFAALQYQKGWRSVAGWSANSTVYTQNGFSGKLIQEEGVKGLSALAGFQWQISSSLRLLGTYMYFDGEQQVATSDSTSKKLEGSRHVGSAGLEYKLSKVTRVFTVWSYSKAEDDMKSMSDSTGGLTRTMLRTGLQHWF